MVLSDDSDVMYDDLKLQLLPDVHPQPIHPVFRFYSSNQQASQVYFNVYESHMILSYLF